MQDNQVMAALTQEGVLVKVTVRYWRATKKLKAEELGLDPNAVTDRLIRLGHKKLLPKEALQPFALIEGRAHALVESSTFPFLNGLGHFLPNGKLGPVSEQLRGLQGEFTAATQQFLVRYEELRKQANHDWREAAQKLPGNPERLIDAIQTAFPRRDRLEEHFGFHVQYFHVRTPERLEQDLVTMRDQQEIIQAREHAAQEAASKMTRELDHFVADCVVSMREQTAHLCDEILQSINGSKTGVHQKTLNRLIRFIDDFKHLNFAGDRQMEEQLERVRREFLSNPAQAYRDSRFARSQLQEGLQRLADAARRLAEEDNTGLVERFGQMGQRRIHRAA